MSWTDERVETLKTLWGEGQSASQIAKVLGGVTRNAVIGKVHRLGLASRTAAKPDATKTAKEAPAAKSKPKTKAKAKAAPKADEKPAPVAKEKPKPVMTHKPPVVTSTFPHPPAPSPYCSSHVAAAYQPMSSRRDRDRSRLNRQAVIGKSA